MGSNLRSIGARRTGLAALRAGLAALCLALALPAIAMAETREAVIERIEDVLGGSRTFPVAFEVLREALAARDAATVASLMSYPMTVSLPEQRLTLRGERDAVSHFDAIFSPDLVDAVLAEDYGALVVEETGVLLGAGQLRMGPRCTDRSCAAIYWLVRAITPAP